jgi:ParB/RepB/Spo0J family partition protein
MKHLPLSQILPNQRLLELYENDDELGRLVISIDLFGVLEPLIVHQLPGQEETYEIISGNRRFKAAKILNLPTLPCIIKPYDVLEDVVLTSHQEHRTRKHSELLRDLKLLNERYEFKQGVRSDSNPKLKKARELKSLMSQQNGAYAIKKLTRINNILDKLNLTQKELKEKYRKLDNSSINGFLKSLEKELLNQEGYSLLLESSIQRVGNCEIRNTDSKHLYDISSESIQLIFTSPPYFQMRNYQIGKNQLGQEPTVEEFSSNLAEHFKECKRVLKSKGTLWVNLADSISNFKYNGLPEYFVVKMLQDGWILQDKIIWVKANPVPTPQNIRTQPTYEHIYVFKKSPIVRFDTSWLTDVDGNQKYLDKTSGKTIWLKSFFDFRDNDLLFSNVANNTALKEVMKKKGIHLTHNATFPSILPFIGIMCCTKKGDTVLDVFNGQGTTAEVANALDRNFIGYELNPKFIEESLARITIGSGQFEVEQINQAA